MRLLHIQLNRLARDQIAFVSKLARHLVHERDALRLGRNEHIVGRQLFNQLRSAGLGQLHVSEDNERGDVQTVAHAANGQVAFESRHLERVGMVGFDVDMHAGHLYILLPCPFQTSFSANFCPPSRWKCRCLTVWPPSSPILVTMR